jgi:hypothetical protein
MVFDFILTIMECISIAPTYYPLVPNIIILTQFHFYLSHQFYWTQLASIAIIINDRCCNRYCAPLEQNLALLYDVKSQALRGLSCAT